MSWKIPFVLMRPANLYFPGNCPSRRSVDGYARFRAETAERGFAGKVFFMHAISVAGS